MREGPAPWLAWAAALLLGGCTPAPIEIATVDQGSLTDGLIAHWPLDEGGGTLTADTSGNQHNGVVQGPAWNWVGGRFGDAVHFGGADQVTVAGFPYATNSYTVSAWVYNLPSEVNAPIANLVSTETSSGGWALFTGLAPIGPYGTQAYQFEYSVSPTQPLIIAWSPGLVTNTWVHLAAVLDGVAHTLTLYAGAATPVTVSAPGPIVPGSTSLDIGHSTRVEPGTAFPATGIIDDVAIYNRPLAPDEIDALTKNRAPDPN